MKKYKVNVNGYAYEVEIEEMSSVQGTMNGGQAGVAATPAPVVQAVEKTMPTSGDATINAPMQGKILDVKAAVGESVVPGQVVAILEAMKMENEIVASEEGTVASVPVVSGQSVDAGDVLITLG